MAKCTLKSQDECNVISTIFSAERMKGRADILFANLLRSHQKVTGREWVFCSLPKPEGRALVVPEREGKKMEERQTRRKEREGIKTHSSVIKRAPVCTYCPFPTKKPLH